MSYASCPTAVVNAPVEIVWALLADPAGWGHDYHCGFNFPIGWRGALTRVLMRREVNAGPVDSLSRLKRAAEMRVAGGENAGRQQEERS